MADLPRSLHAFSACLLAMSGLSLSADAATLVPLEAPRQWSLLEYRLEDMPAATNPFDPDCIRVDATITAPSGRTITVPAFWYQDFAREKDSFDALAAQGAPEWRLRFTPEEAGDYKVVLKLAQNDGAAAEVATASFTATPATADTRHGWVRVAPDKKYFETTDGKPLRLIGENVCWSNGRGLSDYEDWFSAMEQSGQNFARLWLDPWDMNLEHTPGTLNHYSMEAAWKLDYVFSLAEKDGLYLMLCLDHHGMYQADDKGWGGSNNFWNRSNPYSTDLGGPCANADEFFTSDAAATIYGKRLRYLVARYGWSTHLHSWQFFNEIDNIYRQKVIVPEHVVAWHKKMAPVLKAMDPYGHLVTTSLTGGSQRDEYWQIPDLDYTMYHSYGDPAPGRKVSLIAERYNKDFQKPFMIGEFGTSAYTLNLDNDPYLRGFRELLWSGVTGGSCGTAMSWWWEGIGSNDLYPIYAALSRITKEGGWNAGEWTAIPVVWNPPSVELGPRVAGAEPFSVDMTLNQFRRMELGGKVALYSPLAADRAAEALQAYVHGNGDPLKNVQRIQVDAGKGATMSLKVDSIATRGVLVVTVDGKEALRRELPWTGAAMDAMCPASLDETLKLAEGRHVVEIANDGGADWLHLSSLRFTNLARCAPADGHDFAPELTGIVGKNRAILHLVSPYAVYPANARVVNPPLVENAALSFGGLSDGAYSVRWYDTMDGHLVAQQSLEVSGAVKLIAPAFRDQLAAVILPAE